MRTLFAFCSALFFLIHGFPASGQKVSVFTDHQVSVWTTVNFSEPTRFQAGGRYIPTISICDTLPKNHLLDMELSFNGYGNLFFDELTYDGAEGDLKPYRCWIRYSTSRLEIRAGLQKINFGSATVLRPLMWFDKMDTRDPLQLTDGVYGLLGRYYFRSNANLWLWGLAGNSKTKGWEVVPSVRKSPEWGGRFQIPVLKGEAALSFHHRKADFSSLYAGLPNPPEVRLNEEKAGIDGKWDVGPGIWFESVIKHNDPDNGFIPQWETWLNLGADYTIPMGNGLTLSAEYFRYANRQVWKEKNDGNTYVAASANYPFGLLNSLTALVYFDPDKEAWYRFISLQRKYDYWSYYLMGFWNPSSFAIYGNEKGRNLFTGKGIQFMVVLNI